ncbi:MAG: hypothetical protein RL186_1529, partial [Pseudomonadota bacterium]
ANGLVVHLLDFFDQVPQAQVLGIDEQRWKRHIERVLGLNEAAERLHHIVGIELSRRAEVRGLVEAHALAQYKREHLGIG